MGGNDFWLTGIQKRLRNFEKGEESYEHGEDLLRQRMPTFPLIQAKKVAIIGYGSPGACARAQPEGLGKCR